MSLKVALTGGIGVGKTYCAKIFESIGIEVYYADLRAKYLMQNDQNLKEEIIDTFGENSYDHNGQLDRNYLASKVFISQKNVQRINALVHPAVRRDYIEWSKTIREVYSVYEAALVFESNSELYFDKIIVVDAPKSLRYRRITKRDNSTKEQIDARMSKQIDQKTKIDQADFTIVNDEKWSTEEQILDIHFSLVQLCSRK